MFHSLKYIRAGSSQGVARIGPLAVKLGVDVFRVKSCPPLSFTQGRALRVV
jgi:hypothetical protein